MNLDASTIEKIVKSIVKELDSPGDNAICCGEDGIFEDMNDAVEAAFVAQAYYMKQPLSLRREMIKAMRAVMLKKENMETICAMAVEETGMGNYEHKLAKQKLAVEKTPGVEDLETGAFSGDEGLTVVELSPFGVIGAITPTTNPTETIINNGIGMLAAGNAVVFAPHPRAKNVSILCVRLLNQAITSVGGPKNLIVTTTNPSIETSNILMSHPKVKMLVATGGPGIVDTVLRSGKKAIGAGAGNPPVVVDETANIEKAAKDIVDGCTFDNNLPCIAEKEVIVVDQVADYLIFNMKKHGAYEIKDCDLLDKMVAEILPEGRLNRDFVGKDAQFIAKQFNIDVPEDTRVLIMETNKDHPFAVEELMMCILPIIRVDNVDEGIELAVELEHGNRHTAMMHSRNVDKLSEMAKRLQTTIFVKNGPSYCGIGAGGEGHTTFTIAGPTGEGLTTAKSFARIRRCVLKDAFSIR